jgi:membrane protein
LGAVVALLTWTYLSSYIFLFGAELNSEFEHQTARDTTAGTPKPLGARGAWSADHVADGTEGEKGNESPVTDRQDANVPAPKVASRPVEPSEHPLLASRVTNRTAQLVGLRKVGMTSSVVATLGLSLLRKRGQGGAGAALLMTAAGLSLLGRPKRDD